MTTLLLLACCVCVSGAWLVVGALDAVDSGIGANGSCGGGSSLVVARAGLVAGSLPAKRPSNILKLPIK